MFVDSTRNMIIRVESPIEIPKIKCPRRLKVDDCKRIKEMIKARSEVGLGSIDEK